MTTSVPLVKATIFSLGCYIVPKKGGRLVVGATVKPHTFDEKITVDGLSTLMNKAKKLLPAIANAERERAWAGICPLSADGLPFLDEHPHYQNLFIAAGHFRNGILLAPVTGIWMADLVEGKADRLAPFSFNRTQNLAQA